MRDIVGMLYLKISRLSKAFFAASCEWLEGGIMVDFEVCRTSWKHEALWFDA